MNNAVIESGPIPGIKLVRNDEITVMIIDGMVGVMGPGWSYTPLKGVIKMPKKGVDECSDQTLKRIASAAVRDYKRFTGQAKAAGGVPAAAVGGANGSP